MRLRAAVKLVTGLAKHYSADVVDGQVVKTDELPAPSWVEIHSEGPYFYLLRLTEDGGCITDTWHQTLDEAMSQAQFEFGLEKGDWNEVLASES
jgi:hypothetical protein